MFLCFWILIRKLQFYFLSKFKRCANLSSYLLGLCKYPIYNRHLQLSQYCFTPKMHLHVPHTHHLRLNLHNNVGWAKSYPRHCIVQLLDPTWFWGCKPPSTSRIVQIVGLNLLGLIPIFPEPLPICLSCFLTLLKHPLQYIYRDNCIFLQFKCKEGLWKPLALVPSIHNTY